MNSFQKFLTGSAAAAVLTASGAFADFTRFGIEG